MDAAQVTIRVERKTAKEVKEAKLEALKLAGYAPTKTPAGLILKYHHRKMANGTHRYRFKISVPASKEKKRAKT